MSRRRRSSESAIRNSTTASTGPENAATRAPAEESGEANARACRRARHGPGALGFKWREDARSVCSRRSASLLLRTNASRELPGPQLSPKLRISSWTWASSADSSADGLTWRPPSVVSTLAVSSGGAEVVEDVAALVEEEVVV